MTEQERKKAEIAEVMARSRKLVAESRRLLDAVELRRAETDRFLETQGLTREQVLSMRFTPAQKMAANEELRRRGLPAIEDVDAAYDFDAATAELRGEAPAYDTPPPDQSDDVVAERRRKLGNFMQEVRL